MATIVTLQGDNYMVGTLVGAVTLGYYDRAYKVAQWPTGLVTHIVSRVALPTYAKLQDEAQLLGKAFGLTLWVILSVATPLALALFVSAPDFILLIFGEAWAPSAVLLRFLVGYSVLRPLLDDTGALLVATGHPKKVTQLAVAQAVALIVFALPLTVVYGATGTAIGVGLTFLSGVGLAYYFVSRVVRIDWQATFLSPLISVVVALGSYWLLAQFMDLNALPLLLRVIFKGGFVAGMFMLTLTVFQRDTIDRLRYVWRLLRGR